MADFAVARQNMVDCQIRTNKVIDSRLIEALASVPRERFVPERLAGVAYVDEDLPVAEGRYLMEPMVFARLVQALEIAPGDVVLDVGCGTGYSSAVLSRLASTVVALESDPALAASASAALAELGADNVVVIEGPLEAGCPDQAPFNAILVGGSVGEVPEALKRQLADGGRLCAVLAPDGRAGQAVRLTRLGEVCSARSVFDANTPALPGFDLAKGFVL